MSIVLREPKGATEKAHHDRCPCRTGIIREKGVQDTVWCEKCGDFLYCAPRVETGKATRSVTTVHNGVRPKDRARIIERATGRCEFCGSGENLHVGHMLSVEDGLAQGLTETFLNSDENLAASCAECNLGQGAASVSLRMVFAIARARAARMAVS